MRRGRAGTGLWGADVTGFNPEPGSFDGYGVIAGDAENLRLLETGDVVSRYDLWIEGILDYNDLSDSRKARARKWLDSGASESR